MDRENRPVQSFQGMLSRELHENLNGDIVRHASVMLRDGGEGTIRLSLRPETLGTVKIRLEITENKITGRIIVESDEAFKAFEQELHALEQSFRDSGFDGANLEMAFTSGSGQEGQRGREGEAGSLFSGRRAASRYDAAVPGVSGSPDEGQWLGIRLDDQGRPFVNMLV
jgi:flagellar hook-length control protein FliK